MGFIDWVKKDIKKDVERMKRYPEKFIAQTIFLVTGIILAMTGWGLWNLPSPPAGHRYTWDPHLGGFISMSAGFILIAVSLLIYSTMKVDEVI